MPMDSTNNSVGLSAIIPSAGCTNSMAEITLKAGREKSLLRRHPWIFSGAVQYASEDIALGETVDVLSSQKEFLGRAAYSPFSQIRARVWTFQEEAVDAEFFRKRIQSAVHSRDARGLRRDTDSYRLIYAESDHLPGLIVDRYGDVLVLQSLTAGSEFWKETIADLLLEETGLTTIYERSDADVRELEGMEPKIGVLRGTLPQPPTTIHEHSLIFNVNFAGGHKTGFYLDQRRNRLRVRELAKDKDMLGCFCYTGGFSGNPPAGNAKTRG